MHLVPHLAFNGQCRAAFQFYQQVFGGAITSMLSYGKSAIAAEVATCWHDKIIHATLHTGAFELAGSDLLPEHYQKPQGFSISLTSADGPTAARIFAALSESGRITFPFQTTYWPNGFGLVEDRFGIAWEIKGASDPLQLP